MIDIYKIIEEYNPNKAQKTFVVVDDVIVDIPRNNPALSNEWLIKVTKQFSYFYQAILFYCTKRC